MYNLAVISSGAFPRSLNNFATARRSSPSVINGQRSTVACRSHSASSFVHSTMTTGVRWCQPCIVCVVQHCSVRCVSTAQLAVQAGRSHGARQLFRNIQRQGTYMALLTLHTGFSSSVLGHQPSFYELAPFRLRLSPRSAVILLLDKPQQ